MKKNELSTLQIKNLMIAGLLLLCLFLSPDALAKRCRGGRLAKKYQIKLFVSGFEGAIFHYRMKVFNKFSGNRFAAQITARDLFVKLSEDKTLTISNTGQLSFEMPWATRVTTPSTTRTEILNFMCNASVNLNCSFSGTCSTTLFDPETNKTVLYNATVTAKAKRRRK